MSGVSVGMGWMGSVGQRRKTGPLPYGFSTQAGGPGSRICYHHDGAREAEGEGGNPVVSVQG